MDLQQKLSPNFTLGEMIASREAAKRGIPNIPGPREIAALQLLCARVLQPVRQHFGPVTVSSGFRCVRLNKAVGGEEASQHVDGEAADFTVPGVSNLALCLWMQRELNYDQLIYEFGEGGWIHASYRADRLRNEELSSVRQRRKVVYLNGLVA